MLRKGKVEHAGTAAEAFRKPGCDDAREVQTAARHARPRPKRQTRTGITEPGAGQQVFEPVAVEGR